MKCSNVSIEKINGVMMLHTPGIDWGGGQGQYLEIVHPKAPRPGWIIIKQKGSTTTHRLGGSSYWPAVYALAFLMSSPGGRLTYIPAHEVSPGSRWKKALEQMRQACDGLNSSKHKPEHILKMVETTKIDQIHVAIATASGVADYNPYNKYDKYDY